MGFGSTTYQTTSSPTVRTQADIAQEKKDDYTRRWRARQRTLLSQSGMRETAENGSEAAASKKLLGE